MPPSSAAAMRGLLDAARAFRAAPLPLHLTLGNEAADADSLVGALAHALFLAAQPAPARAELIVPVLSCARADFPLRREAGFILERWLGAPALAACAFADDVGALAPPAGAALTLVDHNRLRGPLARAGWDAHVGAIVDHHLDEGAHAHVAGAARCIAFDAAAMRGAGSACSLVAANFLAAARGALDAPLAEALLSVIALDTIGMSALKATERDAAAVAGLLGVLRAARGAGAPTVESLFAELNALRSDRAWWLSLAPRAALGLDFKGFDFAGGGLLGTSALMVGALDFFRHGGGSGGGGGGDCAGEARLAEAAAFARERGCSLLVVMSQVVAPEVARECVLVPVGSDGQRLVDGAAARLLREADFGLEEAAGEGGRAALALGARAFRQRNLAHTRKSLAPFLVRALGEIA